MKTFITLGDRDIAAEVSEKMTGPRGSSNAVLVQRFRRFIKVLQVDGYDSEQIMGALDQIYLKRKNKATHFDGT